MYHLQLPILHPGRTSLAYPVNFIPRGWDEEDIVPVIFLAGDIFGYTYYGYLDDSQEFDLLFLQDDVRIYVDLPGSLYQVRTRFAIARNGYRYVSETGYEIMDKLREHTPRVRFHVPAPYF